MRVLVVPDDEELLSWMAGILEYCQVIAGDDQIGDLLEFDTAFGAECVRSLARSQMTPIGLSTTLHIQCQ